MSQTRAPGRNGEMATKATTYLALPGANCHASATQLSDYYAAAQASTGYGMTVPLCEEMLCRLHRLTAFYACTCQVTTSWSLQIWFIAELVPVHPHLVQPARHVVLCLHTSY